MFADDFKGKIPLKQPRIKDIGWNRVMKGLILAKKNQRFNMPKIMRVFIYCALVLSLTSCDSEKNANNLYTQASKTLQMAKDTSRTYTDLYPQYTAAKENIDEILLKYPSSNVAVGLFSEQIKISGFSLSEFNNKSHHLLKLYKDEESYQGYLLSLANLIFHDIENESTDSSLHFQISNLTNLAIGAARAGGVDLALNILDDAHSIINNHMFSDKGSELLSLIDVAVGYAAAGEIEKAIDITNIMMNYNDFGVYALNQIVSTLIAFNNLDKAVDVALLIPKDKYYRLSAIIEIADAFADAEENIISMAFIDEAYKQVLLTDSLTSQLIHIASLYNRIGNVDKAIQILEEAYEKPKVNNRYSTDSYIQYLLEDLVVACKETGALPLLNKILVEALEMAKIPSPEISRVEALHSIASAYSAAGKAEQIVEVLDREVKENGQHYDKSDYQEIASAYAVAGEFKKALKYAKLIKDEGSIKSQTLKNIAISYSEQGEQSEAINVVESIPDSAYSKLLSPKEEALSHIALSYAAAGEYYSAFSTVKSIENLDYQSLAIKEIAFTLYDSTKLGSSGSRWLLFKNFDTIPPINEFWEN